MSLFSVKPLYSPSVTATNGSATVQVTGNVNCAFISSGSIVSIGSRQIVDAISGTGVDAGGNSTITLRRPWSEPTTTAPMLVFMSYEGLSESVFRLNQITEQAAVNAQNAFVFKGNYDLAAAGALPPAPSAGSEMWRIASAATVGGRAYAQGEPIYYDQYLTQWRSYWDGLGTAARRNVMTSLTDTATPDALMPRGAFGVGGGRNDLRGTVYANNFSTPQQCFDKGFVQGLMNSTPLGIPNTGEGIGILTIMSQWNDSSGIPATKQRWERGNVTYERGSATETTWQPWRLVYTQEHIVGTVSQSAGIPTGAIIQRGTNAVGHFTMFADGTVEYWGRVNLTGQSINPASVGNGSTSISASSQAVIVAQNVVQTICDAEFYDSSGQAVYVIEGRGASAQLFINLGTRPALAWPYLNSIGTSVITSGFYTFRVVGRWF